MTPIHPDLIVILRWVAVADCMGSGLESEGLEFKPRQLQAIFDPGLPKK